MKIFLLSLVVLLFSCKKEQSCFKDAIIINEGRVEDRGYGLVVKFNDSDVLYHPDVLPDDF
jgi:hypothetical protein